MKRLYGCLLFGLTLPLYLLAQTPEAKSVPGIKVFASHAVAYNTRSAYTLFTLKNELLFDGFFKTDKEKTFEWFVHTSDENFQSKNAARLEFASPHKESYRYQSKQGIVLIFLDPRAKDGLVLSYDLSAKEMKKHVVVFDKPVVKISKAAYFKGHVYVACESVNYVRFVDVDMATGVQRVIPIAEFSGKNKGDLIDNLTWHITDDNSTLYCTYDSKDKWINPRVVRSYISILNDNGLFTSTLIFDNSSAGKIAKWTRLARTGDNQYLIAGEYASADPYETNLSSGGLFLCRSVGAAILDLELVPFMDLNGFKDFVPAENGRPNQEVGIEGFADQIRNHGDRYFLVVDYCYTNYQAGTAQESYSSVGVDITSTSAAYRKNGFKHTHALVLELDANRKIKWNKSVSLGPSPMQYGYEPKGILLTNLVEKNETTQVQMLFPSKLGVIMNTVADNHSSTFLRALKDSRKLPLKANNAVSIANIFLWDNGQFMVEGFNPDTVTGEKPDQALFFRIGME